MLAKIRASLLRRKLRREAKRDWFTVHEYFEHDSHGNVLAAYVAEKNMLGERRLRVIWKHVRRYKLRSPLYVKCLIWADGCDTASKLPQMDRV